jgi:hypothetical protein
MHYRFSLLVLSIILSLTPVTCIDASKNLPVYELILSDANWTRENIKSIMTNQSNLSDSLIEVNEEGTWFEDKSQLWNLAEENVSLPEEEMAKDISDSILDQMLWGNNSIQGANETLSWEFRGFCGTQMIKLDTKKNQRTKQQLDLQLDYDLKIRGFNFSYPIIGGINVIFGNGGSIIGYNGPRHIREAMLEGYYPVISKQEADDIYRKITNNSELIDDQPILAYYMQYVPDDRSYLVPVYIYRSKDLGKIIIPAVSFSNRLQNVRDEIKYADSFPYDTDIETNANPNAINPISIYEARAYYYDTQYTWNDNENNARGFIEGLENIGWDTCPEPVLANLSIFNESKDIWIDSADFVFYSGHGGQNGWQCGQKTWFDKTIVPVKYGGQDLEWILFDSCDLLQDKAITDCQENVFTWTKLFNGLHLLLGYGTYVDRSTKTGSKVVEGMKNGETIIHSWFRTAKDIQGPEVWAAVLYPYNNSVNPANDHIWETGSVSADIKNPDGFIAVYSPCQQLKAQVILTSPP